LVSDLQTLPISNQSALLDFLSQSLASLPLPSQNTDLLSELYHQDKSFGEEGFGLVQPLEDFSGEQVALDLKRQMMHFKLLRDKHDNSVLHGLGDLSGLLNSPHEPP
jgi:hypothetical protein